MISKKDLKALLNDEPIEKNSTEKFEDDIQREMNQQQVRKNKTPLTVIICSEQMEHLYLSIKQSRSNTLLCPDVQYLNSVNHLSNVKMIILDCASFSSIEEIGFLIGMFQLLHRCAVIILVTENEVEAEGIELRKILKSEDRLYLIEIKDIDSNLEDKMIACSSLTESSKQRKKIKLPKAVKIIFICAIFLLAAGAGTVFAYPYIQDMMKDTDIYDRNMNVQLDMGKNTILPVKEAYSDAAGNHIIIEELTEAESVKIRIYDNEQKTVSMDEQKITCPDKECDIHHVLTFRHDEDIPYYIIQIENESTVKNVEVDSQYFK